MRVILYLLIVLVSLSSCNNKTIPRMEKQKEQDVFSLAFSSKEDILKWGNNSYGIEFSDKYDELSLNKKDYFILYCYYGHGIIYTDIHVFSRKSKTDKPWTVEIKQRTTNKSDFRAFQNEDGNKFVVVSAGGKPVLMFP